MQLSDNDRFLLSSAASDLLYFLSLIPDIPVPHLTWPTLRHALSPHFFITDHSSICHPFSGSSLPRRLSRTFKNLTASQEQPPSPSLSSSSRTHNHSSTQTHTRHFHSVLSRLSSLDTHYTLSQLQTIRGRRVINLPSSSRTHIVQWVYQCIIPILLIAEVHHCCTIDFEQGVCGRWFQRRGSGSGGMVGIRGSVLEELERRRTRTNDVKRGGELESTDSDDDEVDDIETIELHGVTRSAHGQSHILQSLSTRLLELDEMEMHTLDKLTRCVSDITDIQMRMDEQDEALEPTLMAMQQRLTDMEQNVCKIVEVGEEQGRLRTMVSELVGMYSDSQATLAEMGKVVRELREENKGLREKMQQMEVKMMERERSMNREVNSFFVKIARRLDRIDNVDDVSVAESEEY